MKTSVYSWRVDPELKSRLSDAARSERTSVSKLLDRIVGQWLSGDGSSEDEEPTQARLHGAASRAIGSIRGGNPSRAEEAAHRVKERVRSQRHR